MRSISFVVLACILVPAAAQAQGPAPRAEVSCTATDRRLVYDCRIELRRAGAPLEGVDVTVGADMPSMPMAHNVKPVPAKAGAKPGEYTARIELEMTGEWALKLRLSGPVRDQVVEHLDFDAKGGRPAKRGGAAPHRH